MKVSLVVSLSATTFDAVAMRDGWADLERVAALGFDGVEVAVRDPAEVDGAALVDRCKALNLPVAALGTGQAFLHEGLALASPEAGIRRATIERLTKHIHLASVLNAIPGAPSGGVLVIVGLIRGWAGADRKTAERRLEEGLWAILPAAAAAGVRVVIEPINRSETDFLNTMADALAVLRQIDHPRLGVLADTFHLHREEASLEAALRAAGPHLWHVHVADSNRRAPGWGHLDFRAILAALHEAGYGGYVSGETLPYPDPEGAARQTVEYLRSLQAAMTERRRIS
ncbi:MAG: TIM barrel protein [bacterium]